MINEEEQLIAVGKIVNTHGHKGEVKILPLTDDLNRFKDLEKIVFCLKDITKELTIRQVRHHKNFVIISFMEIQDMNEAITLKNGLLKIPREELRELPEGRFYIFDIIGLNVKAESGKFLGEVVDVIQTGANDVYDVKNEESGKHYLIPALKQIVKKIDLDSKEMIISPIEGLI